MYATACCSASGSPPSLPRSTRVLVHNVRRERNAHYPPLAFEAGTTTHPSGPASHSSASCSSSGKALMEFLRCNRPWLAKRCNRTCLACLGSSTLRTSVSLKPRLREKCSLVSLEVIRTWPCASGGGRLRVIMPCLSQASSLSTLSRMSNQPSCLSHQLRIAS
eukprot:4103482-Prymnesium_polylepis.1